MMRVLFSFLLELIYITLIRAQHPCKDTKAESPCLVQLLQRVKNMLKLLVFKKLLNELLLEAQ